MSRKRQADAQVTKELLEEGDKRHGDDEGWANDSQKASDETIQARRIVKIVRRGGSAEPVLPTSLPVNITTSAVSDDLPDTRPETSSPVCDEKEASTTATSKSTSPSPISDGKSTTPVEVTSPPFQSILTGDASVDNASKGEAATIATSLTTESKTTSPIAGGEERTKETKSPKSPGIFGSSFAFTGMFAKAAEEGKSMSSFLGVGTERGTGGLNNGAGDNVQVSPGETDEIGQIPEEPVPAVVEEGLANEQTVYQEPLVEIKRFYKREGQEKAKWNLVGQGRLRLLAPSSKENGEGSDEKSGSKARVLIRRQGVNTILLNTPISLSTTWEKVETQTKWGLRFVGLNQDLVDTESGVVQSSSKKRVSEEVYGGKDAPLSPSKKARCDGDKACDETTIGGEDPPAAAPDESVRDEGTTDLSQKNEAEASSAKHQKRQSETETTDTAASIEALPVAPHCVLLTSCDRRDELIAEINRLLTEKGE
eukprot:GHVN01003179.1.p1 GENE.GHVN01003179.1~~GHVN01003179.1.p1  ORF type:complete len:482 (+),score=124.19 GHVN01003179.1:117-1562(+)